MKRLISYENYIYVGLLATFAACSSWLFSPPGVKIRAFFGSMVMIMFGPMAEHIFVKTSALRWSLDSAFFLLFLGVVLLRYRSNSKYLMLILLFAVVLWYCSAFVALMNHAE